MCRIILILLFLWVVGLSLAVTIAAVYGPVWSIPLTILGYILLTALVIRAGFKQLLLLPFKMKGRPLRGATVQLHGIERGTRPVRKVTVGDNDGADKEGGKADGSEPAKAAEPSDDREYYWVDVTIKPQSNDGAFKLWEPGELMLMPAEEKISLKEEGDGAPVYESQIWRDGVWAKDDEDKYPGMQRVRLLFGLKPGYARRLKFRYYFEAFGELKLP